MTANYSSEPVDFVPVTVTASPSVFNEVKGVALARRRFGDGCVDFVVQLDHPERKGKVLMGFTRAELRAPGGAL